MNEKLPLVLAIGLAGIVALLATFNWLDAEPVSVSVQVGELSEVPENLRPTTYTPPRNTYLPEMMFLVVKDNDRAVIARCKNMAYRTVDLFSRRENSNLVRADRKLRTLANIVYGECIDVALITHRKGL